MNYEIHQEADLEKTRLRKRLLEDYQEKITNLKELGKESLTTLQNNILSDLGNNGEISEETEKLFNNITDLISTAASRIGIEVLRRARASLRKALYPAYPYDFPQPERIKQRFQVYRDCFEFAVQEHVVTWEEWLLKENRESYKMKLNDIKNISDKMNRLRHQAQPQVFD
jgi:hypothetical protein